MTPQPLAQTQSVPLGVGVIGLGFMGCTHLRAYQAAARDLGACELVAVCDSSPDRLNGEPTAVGNLNAAANEPRLFDPSKVRGYTDPDEFFADQRLSLVSVCTYTDTHVDLAIRALRAGKHVLVEKPVSMKPAEIYRLADVARSSGKLCMPAMCMRFWPGWDWLRDRITESRRNEPGTLGAAFGKVLSATFQRLGSGPSWGAPFYRDESRSGGALMDLHIHDADFISWCFGRPERVLAAGSTRHLTALYHFEDGPNHVVAEGAWDLAPTTGFRMRYLVNFERASADFDLTRKPTLLLHTESKSEEISLAPLSGYDREIRHFIEVITRGGVLGASLEEAAQVAELLQSERESIELGWPVNREKP